MKSWRLSCPINTILPGADLASTPGSALSLEAVVRCPEASVIRDNDEIVADLVER